METGPEPEDEWITVREASKILCVDKGTVSRFVVAGKIKYNGESGKKRRVSIFSVWILKEERKRERLQKDFDEYREDVNNIPEMHD